MNEVERYYDQQAQHEWERAERHRIEFAITGRILKEMLPPAPARILDVGGGPGRYSILLAQAGYEVTLSDLSQGNLDLAQTKAAEAGITLQAVVHANALNLSAFSASAYDAVLLMGPLYHLLEEAEQRQAIAQALERLKPGGLLFAAFITRFASLRDVAANVQDYFANLSETAALDLLQYEKEILATGKHHRTSPAGGFTRAYFCHPDDIVPLMETAGLHTEALINCEGFLSGHEKAVNQLQGRLWEDWVEINYRVCREPSLRGASDHLLYVGRKAVPSGIL